VIAESDKPLTVSAAPYLASVDGGAVVPVRVVRLQPEGHAHVHRAFPGRRYGGQPSSWATLEGKQRVQARSELKAVTRPSATPAVDVTQAA
jgi:hypothetical protein